MKTTPRQRADEMRRVKRDLACYKVFRRNVQAFFKAFPSVREDFSLWMILRSLTPPGGGRRVKRAA